MQAFNVLTKKEVMTRYKVTAHFIKTHPELGGYGKPKAYNVERVEAVLREIDEQNAMKKQPRTRKPAEKMPIRWRIGPAPVASAHCLVETIQIGDIPHLRQGRRKTA